MKRFMCIFFAAILLAGCAAASEPAAETPALALPAAVSEPLAVPRLSCLYYEKDQVLGAIAAPRTYELDGLLAAGVIPHHLVAADMIAGFFSLAGSQTAEYDNVLLVSPSHYKENCGGLVVTADAEWDTPFGLVRPASSFAQALLADPAIGAVDNPKAVEFDHGVAGLVPFVRHYLPGAKLAVCLLQNGLPAGRLGTVSEVITEWCRENNALLVISMDCSHYLMPQDAAARDEETAAAISGFDFAAIARFTDSNVDSPESLTVFLRYLQAAGIAPVQLDHSSSEEKLPQSLHNPVYAQGITTYFVYGAAQPEKQNA